MELVIPFQANMEFDFNSARNSPYPSPPSTPRHFVVGDYFFSAPTSPIHMSEFYRNQFHDDNEFSTIKKVEEDFAFDISEESNRASLSAEELFDGGLIKSLNPPPHPTLFSSFNSRINPTSTCNLSSFGIKSSTPKISQGNKMITDIVPSPGRKLEGTVSSTSSDPSQSSSKQRNCDNDIGRGRRTSLSNSNSGRKATRSLSPLRVSQYPWEEEEQQQQKDQSFKQQNKGSTKKWRLKDFLLFRSSSDGRAYEKDLLRKYSISSLKKQEDQVTGSSRRKEQVSAHELHYRINKAISQEMKKKTFLPYKQGILGRLAFNPAVSALANGFGSFTRS